MTNNTIYTTRYQAQKAKTGDCKIVKVDGGYMLMTYSEYNTWHKQN